MSPFIRQQAKSLQDAGEDIDHFQVTARGARGYLLAVLDLRQRLKAQKYDLIHAHYSYCGIISDLARRNEKLVVSFMGSDLLGGQHESITKTWRAYLALALNRFYAGTRYDLVILKSKGMQKCLRSGIPCEVVPNGVDMSRFYPMDRMDARNRLGWSLEKKIVLFAANPARTEKNFPLAENVVALLKNTDVLLMPVWQIQHELMNCCFNAADALLLTSRYEGSPNVVKEAVACNLPVVSTDVGDVREIIENIAGCFVCPQDANVLASALAATLKEKRRIDGRERIRDLEISVVAQRLIRLYERVLNT